jgi:glycosyltransferase involved in cell wall biosynthesis
MQILQVATVFPPHIGGLEKYVYELSKNVASHGYEVIVVTTNCPRSQIVEYRDKIRIKRIPVLFSIFNVPASFFLPYLLRVKADLINVHSPPFFGLLSSILIGRVKRIPLILTYHADTGGNIVAQVYNLIFDRFVLRKIALIVVPTPKQKRELIRRGLSQNNIVVISNGFDLDRNQLVANVPDVKESFHFQDEKIVLFVGALEKRKGVEFLLKAILGVLDVVKNVRVLIVGDGSEKSNLQNLARSLNIDSRICFMGYVTERLNDLYSISDVFVLPSLWESFGMVLLEAMAHQKPIVATKTTGASELIKPGFNGLLVEPRNPEQLAEAIISILSDQEYAHELGVNGQRFSRNFSWDKTAGEYCKLYDQFRHFRAKS